MKKSDLIADIAEITEVPKKTVEDVFDATFDTIGEYMAGGEKVSVPKFGIFSATQVAERAGRNPATGEAITIAASNRPKFKASKTLKDALNE